MTYNLEDSSGTTMTQSLERILQTSTTRCLSHSSRPIPKRPTYLQGSMGKGSVSQVPYSSGQRRRSSGQRQTENSVRNPKSCQQAEFYGLEGHVPDLPHQLFPRVSIFYGQRQWNPWLLPLRIAARLSLGTF